MMGFVAMRAVVRLLAISVLAAVAGPAAAVTFGFDEFAGPTDRLTGIFTGDFSAAQAFQQGDFTMRLQPSPYLVWARDNPFNADPGGATLLNIDGRGNTSFTRTAGGTFTVNSVDLATFYNDDGTGFARGVTFRFLIGAVFESQSFLLAPRGGLQRFTFDRAGVTAFVIDPDSSLQFDNVTFDAAPVSSVPEPTTWSLLIAGFGLIGVAMRRINFATKDAR